jgi:hypothetical protein
MSNKTEAVPASNDYLVIDEELEHPRRNIKASKNLKAMKKKAAKL